MPTQQVIDVMSGELDDELDTLTARRIEFNRRKSQLKKEGDELDDEQRRIMSTNQSKLTWDEEKQKWFWRSLPAKGYLTMSSGKMQVGGGPIKPDDEH